MSATELAVKPDVGKLKPRAEGTITENAVLPLAVAPIVNNNVVEPKVHTAEPTLVPFAPVKLVWVVPVPVKPDKVTVTVLPLTKSAE